MIPSHPVAPIISQRESGRTRAWAKAGILLCLLLYWAVTLENLAIFPPVGQDEPWIAAAPYKLATKGIYGSDLFAGYYGVEQHNYQQMPLFPVLQAGIFRVAGAGVYQMRLLPAAFGALLLAATWLVGNQVGGAYGGLLAAALLLALRFFGGQDETGVPLLDSARINRYDIAVPVFGLLALWLFNRTEERPSPAQFLSVGLLIGLAGLSHLYGLFWLPALWVAGGQRHGVRYWRQAAPWLMLAGIAAAWLPWLLFVAGGWQDYLGQSRFVADRFDVFNPRFYVENLAHEFDRFQGLDMHNATGQLSLARPGVWVAICGIPAALAIMAWHGWKHRDMRACTLALVFATQFLLFALVLKVKSDSYLIALWPLAAIMLAWLGIWIWDRRPERWLRGTLVVLLCLLLLEGAGRITHRRAVAARTTPYDRFMAQVAAVIPSGARVLGLQHFWLGLRSFPFRTWLLPVLQASPQYSTPAIPMDEALDRIDPDVILMDQEMQAYFDELAAPEHPDHALYSGYRRYIDTQKVTVIGVFEDATYGRVVVYLLESPAARAEVSGSARTP